MKKLLLTTSLLLSFGMFSACSSNEGEVENNPSRGFDDMNKTDENSTNPKERIVGSWLLVKFNEEDLSLQNKVHTFMEDGTWTVSPPLLSVESPSDHQVVTFEDGWAYNADKDVIFGYLDLYSPSTEGFPYRFEMKRKELILSYEPRVMFYCMPPTPMVYYYIRK